MTRKDDWGASIELSCQTTVTLRERAHAADASPGHRLQLTAAEGEHTQQPTAVVSGTEEALRNIASALDRIAAAYLASIRTRSDRSG